MSTACSSPRSSKRPCRAKTSRRRSRAARATSRPPAHPNQAREPPGNLMADKIRILIVDDIPETRDHLTKLLGFETDIEVVGSAASGAEAIQLAMKLTPDVVLMDINMPDMDGIATTELLASRVPTAA